MKTPGRLWILMAALLLLAAALFHVTLAALADPRGASQAGGAPQVVGYQGKVLVGGVPFNQTGYFKFALVNPEGTTSYWSNDNSSLNGAEPAAAVMLSVQHGLFSVLLGDVSLPGMSQPLTPEVFAGPERYLRVWFSRDGDSFVRLEPDQRLASVPYALQAAQAYQLDGLPGEAYQLRVSQSCEVGSAIRAIQPDGAVVCSPPPPSSEPLTTWYTPLLHPQSLHLTDVNPSLKGYYGGFSDGRYAYFVPNENEGGKFGLVVRVDTQNFSADGVTVLDLKAVNNQLVGFHGGFTDGRYGYFVPHATQHAFSGLAARVDLQNFSAGGVTTLDLTAVDVYLRGFHGGFTDGRYAYYVPTYNGIAFSGKAARVDLHNFTTSGVTVLDLADVNAGLVGFFSGFTDGRYGYFVPYQSAAGEYHGKIARIDLSNFTTGGVTMLDLEAVDSGLKGFHGGFTDGRYGYFLPGFNGSDHYGTLVRVDLQDFSPAGVTLLDLEAIDGELRNFYGGLTDGRYGYFVPAASGGGYLGGKLARVDLQNFSPTGVTVLDMEGLDSEMKGFYGAFTDGRYVYLPPNLHSAYHGVAARLPLFFGNGSP